MAKGQNTEVLYRVAKFEIKPNTEQLAVLQKVSDNLRLVWNHALRERQDNFDTYLAPLYAELGLASKEKDARRVSALKQQIKKAFSEHQITLFDQINSLTPRRVSDEAFASVPRNWQEEALDTVNGSFVSFMKLRQNGDRDARSPKEKADNVFMEITGRSAWKIVNGNFILSCKKIASTIELSFAIPSYQQEQIIEGQVKKFTLYRDREGRYWVSLAYQTSLPEVCPYENSDIVFVSLGASSIGVISKHGEEVIPLGRADRHWMPEVLSVISRTTRKTSTNPNGGGPNIHALTKGSRAWNKRMKAKRRMFAKMSEQQKHNRRNIVARDLIENEVGGKLFGHGIHFVVTELVVRSKLGKLADGSKPERGGVDGLNFSAQNTGSIGYLTAWLKEKVKEVGGSVRTHKVPAECIPPMPLGHENKIHMARLLRQSFLMMSS